MKDQLKAILEFVSENIEKHTQKEVLVALDKYFDQTEWSLEKAEFEKMNRDEKRALSAPDRLIVSRRRRKICQCSR